MKRIDPFLTRLSRLNRSKFTRSTLRKLTRGLPGLAQRTRENLENDEYEVQSAQMKDDFKVGILKYYDFSWTFVSKCIVFTTNSLFVCPLYIVSFHFIFKYLCMVAPQDHMPALQGVMLRNIYIYIYIYKFI